MQTEPAERTDLNRLADDGCPNVTGETQTHDLSQLLAALAEAEG